MCSFSPFDPSLRYGLWFDSLNFNLSIAFAHFAEVRGILAVLSFFFNFMCAVGREFLWGAIAGAFGEGVMHPVDTIKTRIQSQAILSGRQVTFELKLLNICGKFSCFGDSLDFFLSIVTFRTKRAYCRWYELFGWLMV